MFYYYNPPYVFQLIPDSGTINGATNVTVVGANFYPSESISCKFDSTIIPGNYIDTNHIWCITPPSSQPGYVQFGLALETDQFSGNNLQYLYIEPAIISSVTPTCGTTLGFTQLTIVGQNFIATGPNKAFCIFNNNTMQIATIINSTLMFCDSPSVLDKFGNNVNNITSSTLQITLNGVDKFKYPNPFVYYTLPQVFSITPTSGPYQGGTQITITGSDFSNSCFPTARFGSLDASCKLLNNTSLQCSAPATVCPDDTVVQVSLNGQQFSSNDHSNIDTLYSYYESPEVSYFTPTIVPNTGSTTVTVYGTGFLFGRNDTTGYNHIQKVQYYCKFISNGNSIGISEASYADDNSIECLTPAITGDVSPVSILVSTNQQDWFAVPNNTLTYYIAPTIGSVNPQFGPIKTKGTNLTVTGSGFKCLDVECSSLYCAFTTSNFKIVTQGTFVDSKTITCQIPPVSRPDVTTISVTLNGDDYTTQPVQYTFFDAFLLSLDPSIVPTEGDTTIQVLGYGFANTNSLKAKLGSGDPTNPLECSGQLGSCIIDVTYIDENTLSFKAPPQSQLSYANGSNVGFNPFEVEISIYGDTYTDNNLALQYYEEPEVGPINSDNSSFTFHINSANVAIVPVTMNVPPQITEEAFLKKLDPACQYSLNKEVYIITGNLINYPLPNSNDNYGLAIACPTPVFSSSGQGTVSVSINGENFVGSQPITVKDELSIASISPQCGPLSGGTQVQLITKGFDSSIDIANLFLIWGTQCTQPLLQGALVGNNNITTITPPAPNPTSTGGLAMVVFANDCNTQMSDQTNNNNVFTHIYSRNDFMYYQQPLIQSVTPHSGIYTGGTPITIQGAYYFNNIQQQCTPKCKFGNIIVEANYISTVQIMCISPPYASAASNVPLEISMNGIDWTTSGTLFTFYEQPEILDINPKAGTSSGGTIIVLTGNNFIDLSYYPYEFMCAFNSINLNIPLKMTPAYYKNSSAILCTSPGGWGAGNLASVELTYNGFDITSSNSTFRFYQVDKVTPLSGPASGDGNAITIFGSGFINVPGISCKIGGVVSNVTLANWTAIQCPIPASRFGSNYFGKVDFFYTLNGFEYNMVVNGFSYYSQPTISTVTPNIIPISGGTIIINGQGFRSDFFGAVLTCKLADTIIPAVLISDTEIQCNFGKLNYVYTVSSPIQHIGVALNNLSYTLPIDNVTNIYIFNVLSSTPDSGVTDGGTLVILTYNLHLISFRLN